jgi:hypothetical protein
VPAAGVVGTEDCPTSEISPAPAVPVIAKEVAEATPKTGVTSVGEVAKTLFPVPVLAITERAPVPPDV